MGVKTVDIVLLPCERMTSRAIAINTELVRDFNSEIILNETNCLPHISLAMGCIDEKYIPAIEEILKTIALQTRLKDLTAVEIDITENSTGKKISAFTLKNTRPLQLLHENVMNQLSPYLSEIVTAEMLYDESVSQSTLVWIRNYKTKSSFADFRPHITLGCGAAGDIRLPIKFTASKLALCHLGNHCTCREVLISVELEK
jgi:hypothetical protein